MPRQARDKHSLEQKAFFPAGESHDRNEHYDSAGQLQLPGSQQDLVEAVAAVQPNYVVVFINGGALGTDWIAQHSPAVVEAFYPGKNADQNKNILRFRSDVFCPEPVSANRRGF